MGSTEDVRRSEWADIFAFTWANQQPRLSTTIQQHPVETGSPIN